MLEEAALDGGWTWRCGSGKERPNPSDCCTWSNGLFELDPAIAAELPAVALLDLATGAGLVLSCLDGALGPSLTSVAIVLSKSPPLRFRVDMFLSLSEKPMSRSCASFSCSSRSDISRMLSEVGLYSTGVT